MWLVLLIKYKSREILTYCFTGYSFAYIVLVSCINLHSILLFLNYNMTAIAWFTSSELNVCSSQSLLTMHTRCILLMRVISSVLDNNLFFPNFLSTCWSLSAYQCHWIDMCVCIAFISFDPSYIGWTICKFIPYPPEENLGCFEKPSLCGDSLTWGGWSIDNIYGGGRIFLFLRIFPGLGNHIRQRMQERLKSNTLGNVCELDTLTNMWWSSMH